MSIDVDSAGFLAGVTAAAKALEASAKLETLRVGRETAQTARQRAPKRTGTLAGSISAHPIKDGVEITATAPYAAYVEYGTSDTPSQPFLRPALQEEARDFGRGVHF